jgi:hypothetical protein
MPKTNKKRWIFGVIWIFVLIGSRFVDLKNYAVIVDMLWLGIAVLGNRMLRSIPEKPSDSN